METNILKIMQQQQITFLIPKNRYHLIVKSHIVYKSNDCYFIFLFVKVTGNVLTLRLLRAITS
jgi:hypothetical protein